MFKFLPSFPHNDTHIHNTFGYIIHIIITVATANFACFVIYGQFPNCKIEHTSFPAKTYVTDLLESKPKAQKEEPQYTFFS